jgi:hypothetical protein
MHSNMIFGIIIWSLVLANCRFLCIRTLLGLYASSTGKLDYLHRFMIYQ